MVATVSNVKDNAYYEKEEIKQSKSKKGRADKENYYSEKNQSKGIYFGSGAEKLGLHIAKQGDLTKIQNGIHPNTDEQIFKKTKTDKKFIDVTLSAPKDFSMLAELDTANKDKYELIFNKAVDRALKEVEKKSYRVSNKGTSKIFDTQLIGIKYKHITARPTENNKPDMQWHSHCLISMTTLTKEDKFRRLENYPIFNNQKLFGSIFRAELANGLRSLGYEIEPMKEVEQEVKLGGVKKTYVNSFKVAGISSEMRDQFSKRNEQIKESMEGKENQSYKNKAYIAQSQKRVKEDFTYEELQTDWKKQANEVGLTQDKIDSLKTFKEDVLIKNLQCEERIIKESFTSKGKLFESKLMLKLQEAEQYTGIPAKEYFNKLQDAGIISRTKGYELSTTIKFDDYKNSFRRPNAKAFFHFRDQFKKNENNLLIAGSLMAGQPFMSLSQLVAYFLVNTLLKGDKHEKVQQTPATISLTSSKSTKYDKNSTVDTNSINSLNESIASIDAKGMSIADIENELLKSTITEERRWQLKMQLEKLYYEQGEAYKRAINSDPYKLRPPGSD